ncbi:cupin domain-containing protein [Mesorhizobium sp. M1329]|uniref:cupin domain-containing protein n=1 Tax=Mesorhizobium sp. M1329 TaxID=2957083 RepID=UPI003336D552
MSHEMSRAIVATGDNIEADEMRAAMEQDAKQDGLRLFQMRSQLPSKGRVDNLLAATDRMWVVLKAYASAGENHLHAHPNEDHIFVVLQGEAEFFGADGVGSIAKKHWGVMLPRGAFYRFRATSEEQLVMLRVGAQTRDDVDPLEFIDVDGRSLTNDPKANYRAPTVFAPGQFFE